jgi:hypothetical protein
MKMFVFLIVALVSFSSFAKECEIELSLSADATHVLLSLTEKDKAADDSELIESIIGSKREQSNCADLDKLLNSRDLKASIDGVDTPVKVVNLSPKPVKPLFND